MKKNICLITCLIALLFSISAEENSKEESDIDIYFLKTGMSLSILKVNDDTYFSFYGDTTATIIEIEPINDDTTKMVISVPWNRAGSFQNYVIYIKTGNLIQILTRSQAAVGIVGPSEYNKISFLGMTK